MQCFAQCVDANKHTCLTGCRFAYEAAFYEAAGYEVAGYEAAYLSLMMSILLNTWELVIWETDWVETTNRHTPTCHHDFGHAK